MAKILTTGRRGETIVVDDNGYQIGHVVEVEVTGKDIGRAVVRVDDHRLEFTDLPIQRVTGFDTVMPYYKLELEFLPEEPRINKAIEEVAAY